MLNSCQWLEKEKTKKFTTSNERTERLRRANQSVMGANIFSPVN